MAKEFKPTHRALRPVKLYDKTYLDGSLLELDDETAENLGPTAVEPYTIPVEAMTASQLADAAKDAKAREKLAADAAKAAADATATVSQTGAAS